MSINRAVHGLDHYSIDIQKKSSKRISDKQRPSCNNITKDSLSTTKATQSLVL
ncbi:MAG TPA: hypothetical protein VH500_11215 [Nitrososphaeraceae archaeon]